MKRVYYPGLKSHPQHRLASRQMKDFGAIVSFEVSGGRREAKQCLESLRIFTLAVSLGGVESLAEHAYSMSHHDMPAEMKRKAGIGKSLIRLSVGIEDPNDLTEDLRQALSTI